ncbi:type II toxin-antitoxin system HipA family toxin [Nocardioides hungaricus]
MARVRELRVYLDGIPIGTATQTPQGALSFVYDEDYRLDPEATPLSLSMPLARAEHGTKAVRAYLDGLLPDSPSARQRWARQYNVSPGNPFALLLHVGRDAAGAVQVLPPEVAAGDTLARDGDIEWLTDDDFAAMAHDLAENGESWDPGRFGGRWSLAGAQPKMALHRDPDTSRWGIPRDATPTTHIIKPAIEGFAQHHINEALCLRAAHEAGLSAAEVGLVEVADVQAVISHRYDRYQEDDGYWVRVHQEDLCQALAVHPERKYQSDGGPGVGDVADLLARLPIGDREISAERFFKCLAFNVLVGGTDAHAKNYSLILSGPRAQLAPLYDVASAAPYQQHERLSTPMKVGDHWKMLDVTTGDWAKVGRRLGIHADRAVAWIEELRRDLPAAFARAAGSLPDDAGAEAERMASRIVEHVEGTWKPDLTRNPSQVLAGTSTPGTRGTGTH